MECSEDKSQTKEVQIDSGAQESTESHKPDPPKVSLSLSVCTCNRLGKDETLDKTKEHQIQLMTEK